MSTSNEEDLIHDIYHKIRKERIVTKFHKQLDKMSLQERHKYKDMPERWEYAYNKVSKKIRDDR